MIRTFIRAIVLTVAFGILFGGRFLPLPMPAHAADMDYRVPASVHASPLPFPRSKRSQSVWASNACWTGCQSYCTWGEAACLRHDSQGRCLKFTDDCDRSCQRSCRTSGGPLLLLDF